MFDFNFFNVESSIKFDCTISSSATICFFFNSVDRRKKSTQIVIRENKRPSEIIVASFAKTIFLLKSCITHMKCLNIRDNYIRQISEKKSLKNWNIFGVEKKHNCYERKKNILQNILIHKSWEFKARRKKTQAFSLPNRWGGRAMSSLTPEKI